MLVQGMKITNFHYTNTVFQPNEYQEYPKWIHMEGYPSVIARDAAEEARLLARKPFDPKDPPQEQAQEPASNESAPTMVLTGRNDEKEILLQIAQERNIRVDKRWNMTRLRATIERETKDL